MPRSPKAVLQDSVNAVMSGTRPLPHASPSKLISGWLTPGSLSWVGAFTSVFWLYLPVLKAVELVTILKLDPGGKVTAVARLSSGWFGSASRRLSFLWSFLPFRVASWVGSYEGYEARARIDRKGTR